MSSQQLWAPQPKREQNIVPVMNNNTVPGTWLQLSPNTSAIPSPAVEPMTGNEPKDELVLSPSDSKFLSNQSRSSSMSSASSNAPRHPSLGQRVGAHCAIERREASLARTGGIATAFGGHH